MVRPTPGTDSSVDAAQAAAREAAAREAALQVGGPAEAAAPVDEQARARAFLRLLGRTEHPDTDADPVYALYQVALDFQCSAYGYRDLYLRKRGDTAK